MAKAQKPHAAKAKDEIRRISLKSIIGSMKGKGFTEETTLMKVAGIATEIERGDGDFGSWAGLVGNFAAVNVATGEITESNRLTIPAIEKYVENFAVIKSAKKSATMKFSGTLLAVPSGDNGRYELVFNVNQAPDAKNPALEMLDF